MVRRRDHDRGSVLPLTLVLVVVMALVVVALARYAATGLAASPAASKRVETNADASGVVNWAIEQFAKKQLRPNDHCGDAPTKKAITVPPDLVPSGYQINLNCEQTNPITGEPVVHLIATLSGTNVATRTVEATVEVPSYYHGARVSDWRVDVPIVAPAYVTTTTGPGATSTTSTSTTIPTTSSTSSTAPTTIPSGSSTSSTAPTTIPTTTAAPVPILSCTFTVTSHVHASNGNGSTGVGQLRVNNTGTAAAARWVVFITVPQNQWTFIWDVAVTATRANSGITVNGNLGVPVAGSALVSANLNDTSNPRITTNNTLPCSVQSFTI